VYVGHAAIALVLKSRAPDVPLVPLTLACYGPDWIELALMIPRTREGMAIYSHSLPALFIGASVAAALFSLIARQPGGAVLFAGWLLHWPADFLTGTKPLIGLDPLVGLDLYHLTAVDFAVESALIILGCTLYARRFAPKRSQRGVVIGLCGILMVVQFALVTSIASMDGRVWRPSLAIRR
jgi:hypothetical protein